MDANCIFCKIIKSEIPSEKIYEDESVLAFMDIRPVSRGHALVIPKNHSADMLSASEEDLVNTTKATQKIAKAVMIATGAAGINVTTNNGAAAGQVVFHLHYHIIPRYSNDGLTPWSHHDVEPKTLTEIAELIKKHL